MVLVSNINNIRLEDHSLAPQSNSAMHNMNKATTMKYNILIQRKIYQLGNIILFGFITPLVLREEAINKRETIASHARIERNWRLIGIV